MFDWVLNTPLETYKYCKKCLWKLVTHTRTGGSLCLCMYSSCTGECMYNIRKPCSISAVDPLHFKVKVAELD